MDEQPERDIVDELDDWAYIIDGVQGSAGVLMLSGDVHRQAAEEIKRLRAELQAARSPHVPAWSGQAPYSPTTETKDMQLPRVHGD